MKPTHYLSRSARGEWCMVQTGQDDAAAVVYKSTAELVHDIETKKAVRAICRQRGALEHLATWTVNAAILAGVTLPSVGIRPRSSGRGAVLDVGHVSRGGRSGWSIGSGSAMVDDDDAQTIAIVHQRPETRDELRDAAVATGKICEAWISEIQDLDLSPRMSAGATAAQLLPERYRKAARRLSGEPLWRELRGAYYGGRVECRRPGWSGEAVEYDLRSAYGASLAGFWDYVPDWKTYDREPLPREPGWYDVTVRASSPHAPLPKREKIGISWPSQLEVWRGWYTRAELELDGVDIVEIHRVVAGRYSDELTDGVRRLLELRDASTDPWRRGIVRQLVVALSGKMAQIRTTWKVWVPSSQDPPPGTVCIGDVRSGLWVYPSQSDEPSATYLPHVAAYVASYPRCELYRELVRAGDRVLYCDTDSIHVERGTPPPLALGDGWGQWVQKAAGDAHYQSARHYKIGTKRVQYEHRQSR